VLNNLLPQGPPLPLGLASKTRGHHHDGFLFMINE
jgi:hypothetical protein